MYLSFHVKLAQAEKMGEETTFGEIAMRALSTRPGWTRVSSTRFVHKDSGNTAELALENGTLATLTQQVVMIETMHEVVGKRSRAASMEIGLESMEAVREWFAEKAGGTDGRTSPETQESRPQGFSGNKVPPAPPELESPHHDLAVRISLVGNGVTHVGVELAGEIAKAELNTISVQLTVAESILALLHFVDKHSFQRVGSHGRDIVMDTVRPHALETMKRIVFAEAWGIDEVEQMLIHDFIAECYANRMQEYAPLELLPTENERGGHDIDNSLGYALGQKVDPGEEKASLALCFHIYEFYEGILLQHGLKSALDDLEKVMKPQVE
jgi:hypothetical protein